MNRLPILLVVASVLSAPLAIAQTRGPFKPGQTLYTNSFSAPPGFVGLNDVFGTKVDTTNGVLTNPTVNGGTFNGITFEQQNLVNPTINGTVVATGTTATDSAPLGPQLLTAGTTTATGWTGTLAAGWTNTASNTSPIISTIAPVVGTTYQVSWALTNYTAGTVAISFGGVSPSNAETDTNAWDISGASSVTALTTAGLTITPTSTFVGTLTVTVKQVTGPLPPFQSFHNSTNNANSTLEVRIPSGTANYVTGLSAGEFITTATGDVFAGAFAGQHAGSAFADVGIGDFACAGLTWNYSNTCVGPNAGQDDADGIENTDIGWSAGARNISGNTNIHIGMFSGFTDPDPLHVISIGFDAIRLGINNVDMIVLGSQSALNVSNSQRSFVVGRAAAFSATAVNFSTLIGDAVGGSQATFTMDNLIGADATLLASGDSNENVIGNGAVGHGPGTTTLGTSNYNATWLAGHVESFSSASPTASNGTVATGSTDFSGEVTEASSETSVELTFVNQFIGVTGHCVISSPNGATYTSYSDPVGSSLTINHASASGDEWVWKCN